MLTSHTTNYVIVNFSRLSYNSEVRDVNKMSDIPTSRSAVANTSFNNAILLGPFPSRMMESGNVSNNSPILLKP